MLIEEFQKLFSKRPGRTSLFTHDIKLTATTPISSKPNRMSPKQRAILEQGVKQMLRLGIIEEGESDYSSPMIIVQAPGNDPRPFVDYTTLNAVKRDHLFPKPNIEDRVEQVSPAKYIWTLDLARGYWQAPRSNTAQKYAAS